MLEREELLGIWHLWEELQSLGDLLWEHYGDEFLRFHLDGPGDDAMTNRCAANNGQAGARAEGPE